VNVTVVAVPSLTAEPVLLVTVGTVPPGDVPKPLKVRLLSPLTPVTVLPNWSTARIVNTSVAPAVGVELAALIRYADCAAAFTLTDGDEPIFTSASFELFVDFSLVVKVLVWTLVGAVAVSPAPQLPPDVAP
jgi:hypothetical protein